MSLHADHTDSSEATARDVQESIESKYAAVDVEESAALDVEANGAPVTAVVAASSSSSIQPTGAAAEPHAMSSMRALANGQVDRVVKSTLTRLASASDGHGGSGAALHLTRDGRVALHKAATVFLLYLGTLVEEEKRAAAEETARTARGRRATDGVARAPPKRLTINVQDIKAALHTAGMGAIADQLQSKRMRQ